MAVAGGQVLVLLAQNGPRQARLFRWLLAGDSMDPGSAMQGPPAVSDVVLPKPVGWAVRVPAERSWSSPGFPPGAWVFAPRLRVSRGRVLASLDTADGHGCVMEIQPGLGTFREVARPAFGCLEGQLVGEGEQARVYGRGPDGEWSGFHDNPLLGFRRGAMPLPIVVGRPSQDPAVPSPGFLPMDSGMAGVRGLPVYAVEIAVRPGGEGVLGVVIGERATPTLLLFPSLDGPMGGGIPLAVPLQGQVIRLRLAATATHVSACVVFRENGAYRVEFHHRLLV